MTPENESGRPGTRLRILHVEDDPLDGELVLEALRSSGFACDVVRVATAADYLRTLATGEFDLILSDYSLPDYNGVAALQEARAKRPDVPFVFLSGTIGEERAVDSMLKGASDYVLKQNPRRLATAIRRVMDQTEERARRRTAEQALQETSNRLQSLIDSAPLLIHAKDRSGRYILVNRRVVAGRGLTPAQVLGRTDHELFAPEEADALRAHDATVWATGEPMEVEETTREDDGQHTYLTQKFLLRDLKGEPYALCGISTDITHAKRLEVQLRQAQKMEAIGRLAGGVAHDFNNLLTVINANAELVLRGTPTDEFHDESVKAILEAGERAANLTRQLLGFSRAQIVVRRPLDMNQAVAQATKLLRRLIGEDIELVLRLSQDPLVIAGDPSQIQQIIMNLAINARDAMPQGGRLTIDTERVLLDEHYVEVRPGSRAGPFAMLGMSDTGVGMDAETQSHIFEPFFTTKENGKGTGLGLATVYGIVKQGGGNVWVYSEVGNGTVFKVYLPLVDEAVPQEPEQPAAKESRGSETVLLVEDNENLRRLAARILAEQGYTVLEARHGEEALARAEEAARAIALLVTDVVMPHMTGPELAKRLTARFPHIKVLYMSGYAGDALDRYGIEPDTAHLLQKPFRAAALAAKVREILDADGAAART